MPRIVCKSCGREVYATAPVEQLFADERRCSRCGAALSNDHRAKDRRSTLRRKNPPEDPGPPADTERREAERRGSRQRRGSNGRPGDEDKNGWIK